MAISVNGIYEDGILYLEESLPLLTEETRVLITFLDEEADSDSPIYKSGIILPVKIK